MRRDNRGVRKADPLDRDARAAPADPGAHVKRAGVSGPLRDTGALSIPQGPSLRAGCQRLAASRRLRAGRIHDRVVRRQLELAGAPLDAVPLSSYTSAPD